MTAQLSIDFKRPTQKDRVLQMFRDAHRRGEWLTNGDFCRAYLPNFRSRFTQIDAELEAEGLHISDAVVALNTARPFDSGLCSVCAGWFRKLEKGEVK